MIYDEANPLQFNTYANVEIHFNCLALLEAQVQLWRIAFGLFVESLTLHLNNSIFMGIIVNLDIIPTACHSLEVILKSYIHVKTITSIDKANADKGGSA